MHRCLHVMELFSYLGRKHHPLTKTAARRVFILSNLLESWDASNDSHLFYLHYHQNSLSLGKLKRISFREKRLNGFFLVYGGGNQPDYVGLIVFFHLTGLCPVDSLLFLIIILGFLEMFIEYGFLHTINLAHLYKRRKEYCEIKCEQFIRNFTNAWQY